MILKGNQGQEEGSQWNVNVLFNIISFCLPNIYKSQRVIYTKFILIYKVKVKRGFSEFYEFFL